MNLLLVTPMASIDDFEKLDIRVGRVLEAIPFPEGKFSTHVLQIDLGPELGTKKSLARLEPNYTIAELIGRQVLCVVNFPPRQIGKHRSEVLTLGVPDELGNVVLIQPDRDVPLGGRLY
jgi:tRNA-binding protein